jgi:hypothetical protein
LLTGKATGRRNPLKNVRDSLKPLQSRHSGIVIFVAVSVGITAFLMHVKTVSAASQHIYELRIYHAVPGKLPVMKSRFRDQTSKILARHNLNVVGYWVTEDPVQNSFVFLFRHVSREEAKKNWEAFGGDPDFQAVVKAEQTEKTLEKADIIWLDPTDFSPMN